MYTAPSRKARKTPEPPPPSKPTHPKHRPIKIHHHLPKLPRIPRRHLRKRLRKHNALPEPIVRTIPLSTQFETLYDRSASDLDRREAPVGVQIATEEDIEEEMGLAVGWELGLRWREDWTVGPCEGGGEGVDGNVGCEGQDVRDGGCVLVLWGGGQGGGGWDVSPVDGGDVSPIDGGEVFEESRLVGFVVLGSDVTKIHEIVSLCEALSDESCGIERSRGCEGLRVAEDIFGFSRLSGLRWQWW
jgi:hypothetical protein